MPRRIFHQARITGSRGSVTRTGSRHNGVSCELTSLGAGQLSIIVHGGGYLQLVFVPEVREGQDPVANIIYSGPMVRIMERLTATNLTGRSPCLTKERMKEALQFYADPRAWVPIPRLVHNPDGTNAVKKSSAVHNDKGQKAAAALGVPHARQR